ncbi:peptidase [Kosakonia cowanii]|nr:peptidase [Kosakonia cowanii]
MGMCRTADCIPCKIQEDRRVIILIIAFNDSGRYTALAAAKSVAGIGVLVLLSATNDAPASFLLSQLSYTQIMVGWVGAPKGAPVSDNAGYANPAQLTTSEIGVSGGGVKSQLSEVATMATIPAIAQPEITIVNGQAVTSSLAVADYFTKRHDDVLKKIRSLECSPEFNARNFAAVEYTDAKGERRPAYQITRDGFAFLAMAFTGKRAAQFKEAYITAFNQMENTLIRSADTSCAAHNAHVVYLYMAEIHRVWLAQIYPMLLSAQSPIASSLYDFINDGVFVAGLVDAELNQKHREVGK